MVAIPVLAVEQFGDVALGGLLAAAALGPSIVAAPIVGAVLDRTRRPGALVAGAGLVIAAAYAVAAFLGPVPAWARRDRAGRGRRGDPVRVRRAVELRDRGHPERAPRLRDRRPRLQPRGGRADRPRSPRPPRSDPRASRPSSWPRRRWSARSGRSRSASAPRHPRRTRRCCGTIAAGFRHIATHRPLAIITASGTLSQFGAGGLAIAAVALAVARSGDAAEGAIIVTAFAIGGLLGALWNSAHPSRLRPEIEMGLGFAATGVFTVVAAADLGPAWAAVAIGVSGLFTAPSASAMLLIRKQQSPPSLRVAGVHRRRRAARCRGRGRSRRRRARGRPRRPVAHRRDRHRVDPLGRDARRLPEARAADRRLTPGLASDSDQPLSDTLSRMRRAHGAFVKTTGSYPNDGAVCIVSESASATDHASCHVIDSPGRIGVVGGMPT